jgi:hypothetical protein
MSSGIAEQDRRRRDRSLKEKALKQATQIRDELTQIERVISNIHSDWNGFLRAGDDAYLKAVAYDLHGFYTGLERVFQSVADTIDDHLPVGENWHKDLLFQMGKEIVYVRPALISGETVAFLEEYLRFRHRVRNIYSFNLIPERIKGLVEKIPEVYKQVNSNLEDFAEFLENLATTTS